MSSVELYSRVVDLGGHLLGRPLQKASQPACQWWNQGPNARLASKPDVAAPEEEVHEPSRVLPVYRPIEFTPKSAGVDRLQPILSARAKRAHLCTLGCVETVLSEGERIDGLDGSAGMR